MKITGYRTVRTSHNWGRPVGDVNGFVDGGAVEVPILVLETDEGLEGIGIGDHSDIERVLPAILEQDPRAVVGLYDRMLACVFKAGHSGSTFGTIGAVDTALWDLKAKIAGEPLWRTLGARDRFVPAYGSGLDIALPDDELHTLYEKFADRGFSAGKLKGGRNVDDDIRRLQIVTSALQKNAKHPAVMLDANESWNVKQAVRYISRIEEELDLTWIEEPVRRWDAEGNAAVSRAVKAAVATGENLTGLEQYRPLLDTNAVDIVQAAGVWGITNFLRVAVAAHSRDLPMSPVGHTANVLAHAGASIPNLLTIEIQDLSFPVGMTVDQDFDRGGVVLGDALGLGISIDEKAIAANGTGGSWGTTAGPHVRPERAGLRMVSDAN